MTHDLKYIIKRIIIGVGIILVLSFLRSILVLNVQALEITNDFTEPIYYVPNRNELHFCDNFITNFDMSNQGFGNCGNEYINQLQLHYYSNFLPSLNQEYPYYIEDTDNPTYSNSSNTKWYNPINYHTLYNLIGYNITLYRYGFKIKPSTDYSIMIEIEKSNNLDYSMDELDLNYFKVNARDMQSGDYDITDYISQIKFEYVKGYNSSYNSGIEGNPYYSNNSYLVIDFHVNDNIDIVGNNLMFSNFSIYVNRYKEIENIKYLENNKAIFNTESSGTMKHRIAFVEGNITIEGECDELSGYCGKGMEYDGELDTVTEEDEDLLQEYETCEALDIPCHLRNIFSAVNNLIVRIGNGIKGFFENITKAIKNLFIPNFENIQQEMQEMEQVFNSKIGFIGDTFELLENIVNKFLDIEDSNGIVNIPQINVPIFDKPIIQAQTWNLKDIFENGAIGTFYNIYKMFISVILTLLMLNYFKREYDRVIRGGSKT